MNLSYSTDIAIFGGGIAGLWLLKRLRLEGYQAILIESDALGSGQTLASQGIIHGGLKYALAGSLTGAANVIADMPARWKRCLNGEDPVDLRGVGVLSDHYYMWSESNFRSKLKTFLGSKSLQGRVDAVSMEDYPPLFAEASVPGSLYRLPDFVIDTPSLLHKLVAGVEDFVFRVPKEQIRFELDGDGTAAGFTVISEQESVRIHCQQLVLAAGEGNAGLIAQCGLGNIRTQVRPLHMVYCKKAGLPAAYVHCIGDDFSLTPRLSVTSHQDQDGKGVWYLGGELAESGVGKSESEQIAAAKKAVQDYFPWVDFKGAEWHGFLINRAEAKIDKNHRPDDSSLLVQGNVLVAFPTKLTLTPSLADKVVEHLNSASCSKNAAEATINLCAHLSAATPGRAQWE